MKEMKDSIDFGKEDIKALFHKMLYPTLGGMFFGILFNLVDGVFVGRGIGSDALAAVNIAAPMFLICIGISLMFGMGGSVVASIHLAKDNLKTARIVSTQALLGCALMLAVITALTLAMPEATLRLFGCTDALLPPAEDYLYGYVPFLVMEGIFTAAPFFIRLSGLPKLAMGLSIGTASLNILLDALFIMIFRWGTFGAALATGLSMGVGGALCLIVLMLPRTKIRMIKLKLHVRSRRLTYRNIGYICRLGFPTLLAELAVAFIISGGNHSFASLAAEPGVAAFSVACYLMPVVTMVYAAISQSAQPIISFNYGAQNMVRVKDAWRITLRTALGYALVLLVLAEVFTPYMIRLFIAPDDAAYPLAVDGIRLFALSMPPLAVNMVYICLCQSLERTVQATAVTLLRGYVLILVCFLALPAIFGITGSWLAVPVAEFLTCVTVVALVCSSENPMKGSAGGISRG